MSNTKSAESVGSLVERLLSESAIQALNAQLDEKGIISNQRLGEHVRNLPDGAAASSYRVLSELLREAASRLSSPDLRQGCNCQCCDHGEGSDCACECHASGKCSARLSSPEGTRGDTHPDGVLKQVLDYLRIQEPALANRIDALIARGKFSPSSAPAATPANKSVLYETVDAAFPRVSAATPAKCDGSHGGSPCPDRECHVRFIDEVEDDTYYGRPKGTPVPVSAATPAPGFEDADEIVRAGHRHIWSCEVCGRREPILPVSAAERPAHLQVGLEGFTFQVEAERPAPTWQPIENAPKGKTVLLWVTWRYVVGHFRIPDNQWVQNWDGAPIEPTHWMPLPAPPGPVAQENNG